MTKSIFIYTHTKTGGLSKTNLKQIIINIDYKFSITQATNQKMHSRNKL